MEKYLGIDIGGTKCAVVRGNKMGVIEEKIRFDTKDRDTTVAAILEAVLKLKDKDTISCGISCGGPLDANLGVILSPPNLPDWDHVEIVKRVRDLTGLPTKLCNDADACALAEWMFGAGKGTQNMIFLTFGTGMGAGLILNGALYSGTNGNAGEVGHIRLEKSGPIGYHKEGSFEGYCSGGGIAKLGIFYAKVAIKKGITPSYWTGNDGDVTAKRIAEAAKDGDATAIKVYKKSGKELGRALAVLTDILNPECIVIGSVYQRSSELMISEMKKELKKEALPQSLDVVSIVPAALGDNIGDIAALSVAKITKGIV